MKLNISKFGKIHNAEIAWEGLTVIAGVNDSGKSTVGKLFYVLTKSLAHFRDFHHDYFGELYYKKLLDLLTYVQRGQYRIKLEENYKSLVHLENVYASLKALQRGNSAICANIYNIEDSIFNSTFKILSDIYNLKLDTFLNKEIDELKNDVLDKGNDKLCFTKSFNLILEHCFLGNYNNSLYQDEEAKISFSVENYNNVEFTSKNNIVNINENKLDLSDKNPFYKDITYIDFPGVIDERFQHLCQNKYDWTDDILLKSYKIKLKDAQLSESLNDSILKDIFKESSFYIDKNNYEFKYKTSEEASGLNIVNIASGAKSLGLIYMFLKYGIIDKETPIILDEPENHLHPQWQIIYAKFIIELVKKGFKVLLTSHSPTFIHALVKGCVDNDMWGKDIINFYLAENEKDFKNYSEIRKVNDCVNVIFKSLSEPVEKFMME